MIVESLITETVDSIPGAVLGTVHLHTFRSLDYRSEGTLLNTGIVVEQRIPYAFRTHPIGYYQIVKPNIVDDRRIDRSDLQNERLLQVRIESDSRSGIKAEGCQS